MRTDGAGRHGDATWWQGLVTLAIVATAAVAIVALLEPGKLDRVEGELAALREGSGEPHVPADVVARRGVPSVLVDDDVVVRSARVRAGLRTRCVTSISVAPGHVEQHTNRHARDCRADIQAQRHGVAGEADR